MQKKLRKYLPVHTGDNTYPPYVDVSITITVNQDQLSYGQMLGVSTEEFGNYMHQLAGEIIDLSGLDVG